MAVLYDGNILYIRWGYINGLMQDCSNSIANTLELLQSCAKPPISFSYMFSDCEFNAHMVVDIVIDIQILSTSQ